MAGVAEADAADVPDAWAPSSSDQEGAAGPTESDVDSEEEQRRHVFVLCAGVCG